MGNIGVVKAFPMILAAEGAAEPEPYSLAPTAYLIILLGVALVAGIIFLIVRAARNSQSKKPLVIALASILSVALLTGGLYLYLNRNIALSGKYYHDADETAYFIFDGGNRVTFYEDGVPFEFWYEIDGGQLILHVDTLRPEAQHRFSLSKDRKSFIDMNDGAQYSTVGTVGGGRGNNRTLEGKYIYRYQDPDRYDFYSFNGRELARGSYSYGAEGYPAEFVDETHHYTVFGEYVIVKNNSHSIDSFRLGYYFTLVAYDNGDKIRYIGGEYIFEKE